MIVFIDNLEVNKVVSVSGQLFRSFNLEVDYLCFLNEFIFDSLLVDEN